MDQTIGWVNKKIKGTSKYAFKEHSKHCKDYSKTTPLLGHRGAVHGLYSEREEAAPLTPPHLSPRRHSCKAITFLDWFWILSKYRTNTI
jgi:hypothetical protein